MSHSTIDSLLEQVETTLRSWRFSWSNESELQEGVATALHRAEIPAVREHRLGEAGRVDFWLEQPGIAIELKTKGSPSEVIRQIHRYAEVAAVHGVILVSTSLRLRLPAELAGKPARTIHVGIG